MVDKGLHYDEVYLSPRMCGDTLNAPEYKANTHKKSTEVGGQCDSWFVQV